jgi:ribosomal protein S18 acetylase RimI-like enzyme
MDELRRRWRERLPDVARWVETRDLLAWEKSSLIAGTDEQSFVVWSEDDGIGSIVGEPGEAAISAAASCPELLAFPENIHHVLANVDGFNAEPATILKAPVSPPYAQGYPCHLLAGPDIASLEHVPDQLRGELVEAVEDGVPLLAAFDGARAVSFAYVASETETLWDVSIDTIASHRRKGYAAAAVLALMEIMQSRGKTAVWGAAQSNPASLALAWKLGFVEVDELWVLTRSKGDRIIRNTPGRNLSGRFR